MLNAVLTGLTVFGFFVSLITLYPRVTVTISGPADDKAPLSASFLISNDGYLPVYSVLTNCMVAEMSLGRGKFDDQGTLTKIDSPGLPPVILYPGAKMAVPFSDCFIVPTENLDGAHLGLLVTYRPMLWFTKRSFIQEFSARNIGNGHFFWHSEPHEFK